MTHPVYFGRLRAFIGMEPGKNRTQHFSSSMYSILKYELQCDRLSLVFPLVLVINTTFYFTTSLMDPGFVPLSDQGAQSSMEIEEEAKLLRERVYEKDTISHNLSLGQCRRCENRALLETLAIYVYFWKTHPIPYALVRLSLYEAGFPWRATLTGITGATIATF